MVDSVIFDGTNVIRNHEFAPFINLHLLRQGLVALRVPKRHTLYVVVCAIVVFLVELLRSLRIEFAAVHTLRQCLGLCQFFIFNLLDFGNSLRSVRIELLLQDWLYLFLYLLLILLLLYLVFLVQLFVSWWLYVPDFESHSSDLYNVTLGKSMSFDALGGIIGILDNFPKHALRILEQILILDQILVLLIDIDAVTLIFRYLQLWIWATVFVLMVDPPVLLLTVWYFCDQIVDNRITEFHI